jgi:hypothetical protein
VPATSPNPTQHRRHAREVDLGNDVCLTVSGNLGYGDRAVLAFRARSTTFDASVVVSRAQLAEYRDALNAVLVATDPA